MDSDDKDAKEPRKKANIIQRAASIMKKTSKKKQSTDSGDTSENHNQFGASNENIQESEAELSNPFFIKSREDDPLPSISELMEKVYDAKNIFGDDDEDFALESLQKILQGKTFHRFVAKETDSKSEEVLRPPLLANLELDSILHLASYNEALFPTNHEEDPTLTGAGLRNLGNTCFVNSVLQCLVHTVPFYEAILSENHSLKCYFISNRFSKGHQDDAHEFLIMLRTRLKELHVEGSPSDSLIKRVFGGIALIKLTCCGCKNSSERTEEIYDVQLPIQDADDLIVALQSHTVGKVDYTCEKCGGKEGAIEKIMIHKAPSIATIQLKRFDEEMNKIEKHVSFPLVLDLLPFSAAGDAEMNKIEKHVSVPLELELLPFTAALDAEMKYKLYGVIVHKGSELKRGHYYCFIQISPDQWIRFDDDRVKRVNKDEVLSQEAYILFYAKQGTAWFIDSIIETTNADTENEASTSPDSWDGGKFGVYRVYNPSTSVDDDPSSSTSSRAEASEVVDDKGGVYSVVDPSSSTSSREAASDIGDGRHGVRLAPITEEEEEEEQESEDVDALTRRGRRDGA